MSDLIKPEKLRGFRDHLPDVMIPREEMLETARRVYRSYGFAPIDTPALEKAEILLGKGGEESDRLVYHFKDHGDRDVALRFDLTVPFARFAAEHITAQKLKTPFKRYHMGPVWRGENTGHGRFREFWQCDFDTIGTTANAADIEVVLVIHDLLNALGVERFQVRVNNRLLLNGLLQEFGLAAQAVPLLRALDKLDKAGAEAVTREMVEKAGATTTQAEQILGLVRVEGDNRTILDEVLKRHSSNEKVVDGVGRLRELLDVAQTAGLAEERLRIDLSIARGLDYYTGTIYETTLLDKPDIGSICSGGRYDNLAGLYTKLPLPGVGASLGLDRLQEALLELNLLKKTSTPAPVLLAQFEATRLGDYQKMARQLRAVGIGVEVYPEAKKLGQQLRYAEERGFTFVLLAGPDEFAQGQWKIKRLATREEIALPTAEVVAWFRQRLLTPDS